jgi:catechol 2,3-dioxygenase-like lactoylglutathione lyase family enzyme
MRIEHIAWNVPAPVEIAEWYCEHLGFTVVHRGISAAQAHFLADETGQAVLEIYRNPPDQVPDYATMNPLQLHLAFASANPAADRDRLLAAGATRADVEEIQSPDGTHIIMLRDPWGFPIQLCRRAKPLVASL